MATHGYTSMNICVMFVDHQHLCSVSSIDQTHCLIIFHSCLHSCEVFITRFRTETNVLYLYMMQQPDSTQLCYVVQKRFVLGMQKGDWVYFFILHSMKIVQLFEDICDKIVHVFQEVLIFFPLNKNYFSLFKRIVEQNK